MLKKYKEFIIENVNSEVKIENIQENPQQIIRDYAEHLKLDFNITLMLLIQPK